MVALLMTSIYPLAIAEAGELAGRRLRGGAGLFFTGVRGGEVVHWFPWETIDRHCRNTAANSACNQAGCHGADET